MNMEIKKKEPERVWRNEKRHWATVERDMRLVSPAGGWILQSHGGDEYILKLRCFGGMGAGGIGLVSHMHETCWRVDFSYRKETVSLQWRRTVPLSKLFCGTDEKDETVFCVSRPRPMRRPSCTGFLRMVYGAIDRRSVQFQGDYYMTDAFMHKCRRWLEGSGVCIPT